MKARDEKSWDNAAFIVYDIAYCQVVLYAKESYQLLGATDTWTIATVIAERGELYEEGCFVSVYHTAWQWPTSEPRDTALARIKQEMTMHT